jgi:hypothetical protein
LIALVLLDLDGAVAHVIGLYEAVAAAGKVRRRESYRLSVFQPIHEQNLGSLAIRRTASDEYGLFAAVRIRMTGDIPILYVAHQFELVLSQFVTTIMQRDRRNPRCRELRIGTGRTEDLNWPVAEVGRVNAFRPQLELAIIRPIPDSDPHQNRNCASGYQNDPVVHHRYPL